MTTSAGNAVTICPCCSGDDSGKTYARCCGPAHSGKRPAATAKALMRSRYSAFALNDEAYLLATHHPSSRPTPAELRAGMTGCVWQGLTIERCKGGTAGEPFGEVTFRARHTENGKPRELEERSQFVFENGRWFYLTGHNF